MRWPSCARRSRPWRRLRARDRCSDGAAAEAVRERLEGPWRQGSERRWLVRLTDGRRGVLAQLLPELAHDEAVRRRYVRDAERLRDLEAPALARTLAIGPPPDPRDPGALPALAPARGAGGSRRWRPCWRAGRRCPIDEALLLLATLADAVHQVHRRGRGPARPAPAPCGAAAGGRRCVHRRGPVARGRAVHPHRRQPGAGGLALPRARAAASRARWTRAPTSTRWA